MSIFTNKSIWKKIAIALVIVILFEFMVTSPVQADDDFLDGLGGKLISPIFSLLVSIGDGVMGIFHSSIMGVDNTLIDITTESPWWTGFLKVISVIIAAACILGAIVLSGGVALALGIAGALAIAQTLFTGSNFIYKLEEASGYAIASSFNEDALPLTLSLPTYSISPEEIFRGNILLFNVDFFKKPETIYAKLTNENDSADQIELTASEYEEAIKNGSYSDYKLTYYFYKDGNDKIVTSKQDSAEILQKTISSWYNAIRNICLVLMLSILVYIGIRMLLSSVASDKAKYLSMLKDWLVGLCLLFLMHYIMAFSVTLVEKLTGVVSTSLDQQRYIAIIPYRDQIRDDLKELGMEKELRADGSTDDNNDNKSPYAYPSNLMGFLRVKAQMSKPGGQYIGEAIMFCILVIFTVIFTFTYLKRLLYMAFLTLIAPLVALTYCIDKLNDGSAQGFNKWFKEYIFNLLIQPMHLLLYFILVASAFETMGDNIVYSIVALGFMIPAEKLLRSLFGFEKAHTPPAIGPAAATMAGTALTSLLHKRRGGKGLSEGKGGGSKGDDSDSGRVPMPRESNPIDAFKDNGAEQDNTEGATEQTDQQRMLDAYDDNYNTNEWDAEERDAMAREAYKNNNKGMDPSSQEYADILRESGYTEDEIREMTAGENSEQGERETNATMTDSNSATIPQSNQPRQTKKKGKIRRAVARKAHAYRAVGRTVRRNAPKLAGKGIRMAGSVAGGVALGALAAGAGVAIGAATGDPSNVIKMGGGAATAGYAMGSGAIKNAHARHLSGEYKEAYDNAYNSPEYKEEAQADYIKDYRKNATNRGYFEEMFGVKEAKEMFKKGGEIEYCLNEGITDKKEIAAIHQLYQDKKSGVKDYKQAVAVSQLGSMIGKDTTKMTKKSRGEWTDRIAEMAGKSGFKEKDKFAKDRLDQIDKLNDIKSRL